MDYVDEVTPVVIYSWVRPEETTVPMSKWERTAEAIRAQIRSGQLKPGDRLPTIRQLKDLYGVSYGSLRAATLVLKAEGWIRGEQGDGVFVADRPPIEGRPAAE